MHLPKNQHKSTFLAPLPWDLWQIGVWMAPLLPDNALLAMPVTSMGHVFWSGLSEVSALALTIFPFSMRTHLPLLFSPFHLLYPTPLFLPTLFCPFVFPCSPKPLSEQVLNHLKLLHGLTYLLKLEFLINCGLIDLLIHLGTS